MLHIEISIKINGVKYAKVETFNYVNKANVEKLESIISEVKYQLFTSISDYNALKEHRKINSSPLAKLKRLF